MTDDDSPYQEPEDELVSDTRLLYKTGAVAMPALADVYRDLRGVVPGADAEYPFRRVGGVGRGETGPFPEFVQVLDYLGSCLELAEHAVVLGGEALCQVAEMFAHTDAETGRSFDDIRKSIDDQAKDQAAQLSGNSLDNQLQVVDEDDIPDAPELSELEEDES